MSEYPNATRVASMVLKVDTSKVKAAAKKWEKRQEKSKRGRFMRSVFADQEADELQGFVDDIKDALQMFMVGGFPSEHTPFISMTDIPSQTAANVDQILERFVSFLYEAYSKEG